MANILAKIGFLLLSTGLFGHLPPPVEVTYPIHPPIVEIKPVVETTPVETVVAKTVAPKEAAKPKAVIVAPIPIVASTSVASSSGSKTFTLPNGLIVDEKGNVLNQAEIDAKNAELTSRGEAEKRALNLLQAQQAASSTQAKFAADALAAKERLYRKRAEIQATITKLQLRQLEIPRLIDESNAYISNYQTVLRNDPSGYLTAYDKSYYKAKIEYYNSQIVELKRELTNIPYDLQMWQITLYGMSSDSYYIPPENN